MFKDKVVWITGASSGIGEALALELAKQGAKLVLSARREDVLKSVKEQCDILIGSAEKCLVLPMDITQEDDLLAKAEQVKDWGGSIDLLINNAGISQRSSCVNTEMQTYRKIFELDVIAQIAVTKAVLPIMIEQGRGHVAVTSSVSGKIGVPFRTGYCAAKHAVMGFFDALRTEVHHHNIQVTTITPGFIRTDISANSVAGDGSNYGQTDNNIRDGMDVNECARVIVRGFNKGIPEIPVGNGFEMNALWIKRFFPKTLFKLANKQYKKMSASNDLK